MELTFINAEHERIYREAKAMFDAECQREISETERLAREGRWELLPHHERYQKVAELKRHFVECRRPYAKILTDIMALCPITMIVPKSSVMDQ